ncbi:YihY/virulence factor BrkB family protein [Stieleria sp. JC731]|uniref:YihY/virulence factor BrkB family protein n=1 Tax=Pirellulaceae TaxID=2691357 RepID=UPI001E4C8CB8|nr:YihY/virulence factor BrkB family protein [Stieleria sp. JC731]MCC9603133.1 YihY/virulence factor BrkB family protein [Stieleria sp. JC731]
MEFLKRVFGQFSSDNCSTLAAALAYYTAFALPPLLFLLLTVLTFGMSTVYESEQAQQKAQQTIENQAAAMIGNQQISDEISSILQSNRDSGGKWWKTIISFVGILIGATGVVAALQAALNQVWEVKPDPEKSGAMDFVWKRVFSLGMILGLAFLLLVSLVVSTVLTGIGDQVGSLIGMGGFAAEVINFTVQAIVVMVVFAAIFKFMPDAEVEWRDVAVGAAITTVLFLVGRYLLQVYFQFSEPGAQLGSAAASLAVLLVWIYYTGMIVLLGAEATQVYASMYGEGIRPEPNAVRVKESYQRPDARKATHA